MASPLFRIAARSQRSSARESHVSSADSETANSPVVYPLSQLSVKAMDDLQARNMVEDWQKKTHIHLDFSNKNDFALTTFEPLDFCWGGLKEKDKDKEENNVRMTMLSNRSTQKTLEKPVMPVYKVKTLNLDNNKLTDADCEPWTPNANGKGISGIVFRNLEVLRMKHNLLKYPMLLMPRLRELHLSHNEIVRVPPLAGLKHLEVLALGHNRIENLEEQQFKDTHDLKRLHLNNNNIRIDPSGLMLVLEVLESTTSLENLQLQGNPFCTYFSEYQIFVVWFLRKESLKRVDDLELTKVIRSEMLEEARKAGMDGSREDIETEFHRLDEQVRLRKQGLAVQGRSQNPTKGAPVKIDGLIEQLDAIFTDSTQLMTTVQLVYEMATQSSKEDVVDAANHLFDVRLRRDHDARSAKEGLSATFVQQVTLLAERFPEARPWLLRTLAKFCPIAAHKLGELCMGALVTLARGGEARTREVLHVVSEMLLPLVADKAGQSPLGDSSWETIVVGLSKFQCPELVDILTTHSVVPHLFFWYKKAERTGTIGSSKLSSALISLLSFSLERKETAKELVDPNNLLLLANNFLRHDEWVPQRFADFLGVGGILLNFLQHAPAQAVPPLRKHELPGKLIRRVQAEFDNRVEEEAQQNRRTNQQDDEIVELVRCKKVAMALDLLFYMLKFPGTLESLLRSERDFKAMLLMLLKVPADAVPDPLVLASSLSCLRLVLDLEATRDRAIGTVMEKLQLERAPNKLLPHISVKRFPEMYRTCEKHSFLQNDAALSNRDRVHLSSITDFADATDTNSFRAISSVVDFIKVFNLHDNEKCKKVSSKLNEQNRDSMLFKLLGIPSEDVQHAVLDCVEAGTGELDEMEQKQLVDMLDSSRIGQDQSLLAKLLKTVQALMEHLDESGEGFRTKYAAEVLERTYDVLVVNADHDTHGNFAEEEQKLRLSQQAVSLLSAASQHDLKLRKVKLIGSDEELLRSNKIVTKFWRVIKSEETTLRPSMADVCLERTWTGRSVKILLGLLAGSDALQCWKKQAYRICHRIADVVTGTGEDAFWPPADRGPKSTQRFASEDADMWSSRQMRLDILRMEDTSFNDRHHQQEYFAWFHALDQMLHFAESGHASATGHHESVGHQTPRQWHILSTHLPGISAQGGGRGPSAGRSHQRPVVHIMEMQNLAANMLREVAAYGKMREQEKSEAARALAERETAEEIQLPVTSEERCIQGESLLCRVYMEAGWWGEDTSASGGGRTIAVPVVPSGLRTQPEEKVPDAGGYVPQNYFVAALLRSLYALLIVPADDTFKKAIIGQIQDMTTHRRLLALVEQCGNLVKCNVGAKLLHVLSLTLQLVGHHKYSDLAHGQNIHNFILVSAMFAHRCVRMMVPLLESLGRDYMLTWEQQTLIKEAIRLLSIVCHIVMMLQMSEVPEVQAECTELAFRYAMPPDVVRGVFMCLLYDMQLSSGKVRNTLVNTRFVECILSRQELYELCLEALAHVAATSAKGRYEVISLVNSFKVLRKHSFQMSFLHELVVQADNHQQSVAMQQLLDKRPVEIDGAEPFFMGEWTTRRRASDDSCVGVAFMANVDFCITAVGLPAEPVEGGASTKVTLWAASDYAQRKSTPLASVDVPSPTSKDLYSYVQLDPPVWVSYGQEYRLVRESREALKDHWNDDFLTPADANALTASRLATFRGGVSGPKDAYPAQFDGDLRRAGVVNFLITEKEYILVSTTVELLPCGTTNLFDVGGSLGTRRMIITNKRMLLTEESEDPALIGQIGQSSLMVQGSQSEFNLSELTRVICSVDPQLMIVGFARSQYMLGIGVSEQFICCIFHMINARQRVVETICSSSGPNASTQIHPSRGLLINEAVQRQTSSETLCMSYAFSGDKVSFFILTHTEFCEFELRSEYWVTSPTDMPYVGEEDVASSLVKEEAVVKSTRQLKFRAHPNSELRGCIADRVRLRKEAVERTQLNHYKGYVETQDEQQVDKEDSELFAKAQQNIFRRLRKVLLSQLMEVEFENGDLPFMRLSFLKFQSSDKKEQALANVRIRFLDDVARERWRRSLAVALHGQSDSAVRWHRDWV